MPITIRFRGTAEDLNQCRRSARSPSAIIGVECRVHRPSGHSKGICTNADEVHGIRLLTSRQNFSRIQICSTAVSFRRVDQEHSLPGPHRSAVSFSPQLDATHPLLDRNAVSTQGHSAVHPISFCVRQIQPAEPIVPTCTRRLARKLSFALLPQAYRTIVQDDRHGATLDDIEHTISNAVINSVVQKS